MMKRKNKKRKVKEIKLLLNPGDTFGRLVVLNVPYKEAGETMVLCGCSCGNQINIACRHLIRWGNPTISCGCARREHCSNLGKQRLKLGTALRTRYSNLKYLAKQIAKKQRKLLTQVFDLTIENATLLWEQDCYYCGRGSKEGTTTKSKGGEIYTGNGIDQIIPGVGYTLNNVRTCCEQCNCAKLDHSEQEFEAWISRLFTHRQLITAPEEHY